MTFETFFSCLVERKVRARLETGKAEINFNWEIPFCSRNMTLLINVWPMTRFSAKEGSNRAGQARPSTHMQVFIKKASWINFLVQYVKPRIFCGFFLTSDVVFDVCLESPMIYRNHPTNHLPWFIDHSSAIKQNSAIFTNQLILRSIYFISH